jgi:methylmalonyl-CoA mutase cobalamin-binding domain/chain
MNDKKMNKKQEHLRFAVAIPGDADENDLNAKVVSMAFRDSGFEVIYLGAGNTPSQIIKAALQEDVDGIYLSLPDKNNLKLINETLNIAKDLNFIDSNKKYIILGGTELTPEEIDKFKADGLAEIYNIKMKTHEIIESILTLFQLN